MKNRKGFTITELVIVIAVIAILAAVLIPTFSSIITKANNNAALQEARNIYTQHVADTAEDGDTVQNGWIKVEKNGTNYYVEVENGALDADSVTTTAPANVDEEDFIVKTVEEAPAASTNATDATT